MLRPHWRGYLAEALARAGRVEEGLETLEEALEQVERTGERFNEAELHRLKGELLLQRGAPGGEAEAEACFQKAIAVARGQEARSWELRATVSLARLWQRTGEARGGAGRRSPPSTAGSPRASTPPTCRRPGRCSRSSPRPPGTCPKIL